MRGREGQKEVNAVREVISNLWALACDDPCKAYPARARFQRSVEKEDVVVRIRHVNPAVCLVPMSPALVQEIQEARARPPEATTP
jgi:hypothetical protein